MSISLSIPRLLVMDFGLLRYYFVDCLLSEVDIKCWLVGDWLRSAGWFFVLLSKDLTILPNPPPALGVITLEILDVWVGNLFPSLRAIGMIFLPLA